MKNNENISLNGFFEEKLSFFGLKGALPMAFTDRILQNEYFDNIDNFFDEMLFLLEEMKNNVQHSCLISVIKSKLTNKLPLQWKLIQINKYNRIGVDRIGKFILGSYKRYQERSSLKSIGRINFIKLHSLKNI